MGDIGQDAVSSASSHSRQQVPMSSKMKDSTWIYHYREKQWPIVLCDDSSKSTVLDKFLKSRPPGHAHPAVLLGKHILIWVPHDRLMEYDRNKDYLQGSTSYENDNILSTHKEEDKLEKARHMAFLTDAPAFKTAEYWVNYIGEKSNARKLKRELDIKNSGQPKFLNRDDDEITFVKSISRKRKSSQSDDSGEAASSRKSSISGVDHSEKRSRRRDRNKSFREAGLPTPDPTPVKSTARRGSVFRKAEERGDKEDSGDGPFVQNSKTPRDPFASNETTGERNIQKIKDNRPSDECCTVFVGEENQPFIIPRDSLAEGRDSLADRVEWSDELGSHVFLQGVDSLSYRPIHQFIVEGDFNPRLRTSTVSWLEGVLTPDEIEGAASDIAKLYYTASHLQFADLQQLCVDKLKVFSSISARGILVVAVALQKAESYGCDAEQDIELWLVDVMAKRFRTLIKTEGMTLERVMTEMPALKEKVMAKVADNRARRRGND